MSDTSTLKYTAEHEWVAVDGDTATVGVTAFAAESLGDVVYLDLPAVGTRVTAGRVFGEIESTKSVSELYAPVTGEVLEINQDAVDAPEVVNAEPYDEGWLIRVRVTEMPDDLLDEAAYQALIAG